MICTAFGTFCLLSHPTLLFLIPHWMIGWHLIEFDFGHVACMSFRMRTFYWHYYIRFWFIECVLTHDAKILGWNSSRMWTSNMFCIRWISRTSPTKRYSKFKQYGNWIAIDWNYVQQQQNVALFSVSNVFAALRCVLNDSNDNPVIKSTIVLTMSKKWDAI